MPKASSTIKCPLLIGTLYNYLYVIVFYQYLPCFPSLFFRPLYSMKLVADGVGSISDAVSNISDSVSSIAEGVGNRFHQIETPKR